LGREAIRIEEVFAILLPLIREHEGKRLKAYVDPVGVWTIGYGHTKDVFEGMEITEHEAELMLMDDAGEALVHTLQVLPELVELPPNRIAAITDFTFNLGVGRLRTSTLCQVIKAKQFFRVPDELRRWVYGTDIKTGNKVKLNGLIRRRDAEVSLWEPLLSRQD
jgi:lysozyme